MKCATLNIKEAIEPCIPYGFGLSYTTFEVSQPAFIVDEGCINASCLLKNTGSICGDEAVQFYAGFSSSAVDRPVKLLRGFKRITLESGESTRVTISCPLEKLKWYNPDTGCWELEHMSYEAYIGTSSNNSDLLQGNFTL